MMAKRALRALLPQHPLKPRRQLLRSGIHKLAPYLVLDGICACAFLKGQSQPERLASGDAADGAAGGA